MKLQETPVVFVSFCNDYFVLAHEQVGPIVLRYASQEGGTSFTAFCEYMCYECRSRGLPVCACNGEAFLPDGDLSQHTAPLDYAVAVLPDVLEFFQAVWNGWSIHYESIFHPGRDVVDVVFVVDRYAFLLQLAGKVRWRTVISAHTETLELVIAGDGAHTYAANADEVYVRVCHLIRVCKSLLRLCRQHRAGREGRRSFLFRLSFPCHLQAR